MDTTTHCYFCGAVKLPTDRPMTWCNTPHWAGSPDREVALTQGSGPFLRVDVCGHEGCRDQVRDFPRAPRRPRAARRTQPLYGDLRWVAAINGIATDGSGEVVR